MKIKYVDEKDLKERMHKLIKKHGTSLIAQCKYAESLINCLLMSGKCRKMSTGKYEVSEDCFKKADELLAPISVGDIVFNPEEGHLLVLDGNTDGILRCLRISVSEFTGEWRIADDGIASVDLMSTFRISQSRFDIKKVKTLLSEISELKAKLKDAVSNLYFMREDRK